MFCVPFCFDTGTFAVPLVFSRNTSGIPLVFPQNQAPCAVYCSYHHSKEWTGNPGRVRLKCNDRHECREVPTSLVVIVASCRCATRDQHAECMFGLFWFKRRIDSTRCVYEYSANLVMFVR